MIRCFLLIIKIDIMNISVIDIKKYFLYFRDYFIYLVYPYFILHFSQKNFNILKDVLYIKKLAVSLLIILNKSVIT